MDNKICKNCNIEKNVNKFPKMGGKLCKICFNEYMKLRRPKKEKPIFDKKEYQKEYHKIYDKTYKRKAHNKICRQCEINKPIIDFKTLQTCKKCYLENKRIYNKTYMKTYYVKNKDVIKDYVKNHNVKTNYYNNYRKERYNKDIIYRNKCLLRSMVYDAFNKNALTKSSKTENIIGLSYKDYITYIETQFEPWMTWGNHGVYTGNYNETWQIDHIQPISNASTTEEIIKLNHYTNLRPLCSRKNLEKSNINFY